MSIVQFEISSKFLFFGDVDADADGKTDVKTDGKTDGEVDGEVDGKVDGKVDGEVGNDSIFFGYVFGVFLWCFVVTYEFLFLATY